MGQNNRRGEAPHMVAHRLNRCVKGHPFTEANTYVQPSNGYRRCRTCRDEYMAAYRAARREEP